MWFGYQKVLLTGKIRRAKKCLNCWWKRHAGLSEVWKHADSNAPSPKPLNSTQSESKCCGPLQEVTGPSFYHFFLTERNRALAEPQKIKRLDVHIYIFRLLHWRWIHQACPFNGQLGRVAMLNKWNASFLLHSQRNRKKVFVNVSSVRGRCNAQSHIISVLCGKKWHLQNESLK